VEKEQIHIGLLISVQYFNDIFCVTWECQPDVQRVKRQQDLFIRIPLQRYISFPQKKIAVSETRSMNEAAKPINEWKLLIGWQANWADVVERLTPRKKACSTWAWSHVGPVPWVGRGTLMNEWAAEPRKPRRGEPRSGPRRGPGRGDQQRASCASVSSRGTAPTPCVPTLWVGLFP